MKNEIKQIIKFCMVGTLGASLTYFLFFIFYHFYHIHYLISLAIGFMLSVFVVFFLNKSFTFQIKGKEETKKMMIKYYGVNIFSLILGMIVLVFFVKVIGISPYIGSILVIGITTITNFIGSKILVFKLKYNIEVSNEHEK